MKVVEETGQTVEEAVEKALTKLGVAKEQAKIEVLEEPTRGILGLIKAKPAKVRVEVEDDPAKVAEEFLTPIFKALRVEPTLKVKTDEKNTILEFWGEDLGIIVGRRGETLDALQYLTNLAVSKKMGGYAHIILDVEGYRERRRQSLQRLAQKISSRVERTGRRAVLEAMNADERRVIHLALQDNKNVYSFSEGDEPNRKVVIALKQRDQLQNRN